MNKIIFFVIIFLGSLNTSFSQCDSVVIRAYQVLSLNGWANDSISIDSLSDGMLQNTSGYYSTDTLLVPIYRNEYAYDSTFRIVSLSEYYYYSLDSVLLVNFHGYTYSPSGKISSVENYSFNGSQLILISINNYTYDSNDSLIFYEGMDGEDHNLSYTHNSSGTTQIDSGGYLVTTTEFDTSEVIVSSSYVSYDGYMHGHSTYICNGQLETLDHEYDPGSIQQHVWTTLHTEFDNCIPQFQYMQIIDIGINEGYYRTRYYYASCQTAVIVSDDTVGLCYNEPTQNLVSIFGGTAPYTYSWSPSIGLSSDTVLNPVVLQALDTIYTLSVTDSTGNIFTKSICFSIYPEPFTQIRIVSIDSTSICNSAFLTADSVNNNIYEWYLNGTFLQYGDSSSLNVFINHNGTYTVISNSIDGCTSHDTLNFIGLQNPSPAVSLTQSCNDLIAVSADSLSYQWLRYLNVIPLANRDTLTISQNGSYSIIVTNAAGCIDTSNAYYANAFKLFTATYPPCDSACDGFATVHSSMNIQSILWSNGDVTQTASLLCPGPCEVMVTDYRGCTLMAYDTLEVNPVSVQIDSIAHASCSACFDGIAYLSITGGTPPYSYSGPGIFYNSIITGLGIGANQISITDHRNCSVYDTLLVGVSTNVLFNQNDFIRIFPNPVTDFIFISELLNVEKEIVITDVNGIVVYNDFLRGPESIIDVRRFIPGLYQMIIRSSNFISLKRVLIVH